MPGPVLTGLTFPSTIDVRNGSTNVSFSASGTANPGHTVDGVTINFNKYFDVGNSASYTQQTSLTISGNANDSNGWSDSTDTILLSFSSADYSKDLEITSLVIRDDLSSTTYTAADLAAMGFGSKTSIVSNKIADNSPPVLTSLHLPDVLIQQYDNVVNTNFTAAGTDDASGFAYAIVTLDTPVSASKYYPPSAFKLYLDPNGGQPNTNTGIYYGNSFATATAAGVYHIVDLKAYDNAGNVTDYSAPQLAALGFANSFTVTNYANESAYVTAPSAVTEGNGTNLNLSLTLRNVAEIRGAVTMTLLPSSTATTSDVIVPSGPTSFHLVESSYGDYTIALPTITVLNDNIPEPDKTIDIQVYAPGQIFANGTDTTTVHVTLYDDDGRPVSHTYTGTAGNDIIHGSSGDDTIDGLAGADTMYGGPGDDLYGVDNPGDVVIEQPGEGHDRIASSISYTLPANVEDLTLTQSNLTGTGNELNNVIVAGPNGNSILYGLTGDDRLVGGSGTNALYGGAGSDTLIGGKSNDVLDGGTGADTMIGGDGSDAYYVDDPGDRVIEEAGQPGDYDKVFSTISFVLPENVENLTLLGTAALSGTGNALNNIIVGNAGYDILHGGSGNDGLYAGSVGSALYGDDGNDVLYGGGGNDLLDGGAGVDIMLGGFGDDTYVVDDAGDQVIEPAGAGSDLVLASVSYDIPANVERITLTGTGNINSAGNALDNIMIGNAGHNILVGREGNDYLDGGAGADTLVGGSGDDTYVVDNAGDSVVELSNEGIDLVLSSVSYTLPDNVERLKLTGTANINGGGNALDNVITGNLGNNQLAGFDGNDVITAGGGRDIVDGGNGDDMLVLQGSRADYSVFTIGTFTFLVGATEAVRAANIETVRFADGTASWSSITATALPFDAARYLVENPDVAKAFGSDQAAVADHFVQYGFVEGRAAGGFSATEYLASNPDLIRAFGLNTLAATQHYQQYGISEHRATSSFDPYEYLASNPDLIKALGANATAAENHYISYGLAEGRQTTSFNALEYLASSPDLIKALGDDTVAAERHYAVYGYSESRPTTSFDALKYIASYGDLIKAFGEDVVSATKHYVDSGYAEGRSASFDPLAYAAASPDLAKAFGTNAVAAEKHYIDNGYKEGRPTSGFDAVAYALTYQDLGKAGLTIDQDLTHWLTYGAKEGRVGDSLYGREQTNHTATLGATTHDTLGTATDHDWFKVTLNAGQNITFSLAAQAFDPLLQIFDDHGVLQTQAQGATTGATAALTFAAAQTGVYYIATSAIDGHSGDYDLKLSYPSIPLQAREVAAVGVDDATPLPADHVQIQPIGMSTADAHGSDLALHHVV